MNPGAHRLLLQGLAKKTLAYLTIELFAEKPVSKPRYTYAVGMVPKRYINKTWFH